MRRCKPLLMTGYPISAARDEEIFAAMLKKSMLIEKE